MNVFLEYVLFENSLPLESYYNGPQQDLQKEHNTWSMCHSISQKYVLDSMIFIAQVIIARSTFILWNKRRNQHISLFCYKKLKRTVQ